MTAFAGHGAATKALSNGELRALPVHRHAGLFRPLEDDERERLRESIRNGYDEGHPIVAWAKTGEKGWRGGKGAKVKNSRMTTSEPTQASALPSRLSCPSRLSGLSTRPSIESGRVRFVGLDVGERRIGVAVSDLTGTLARPLTVLKSSGLAADAVEIVAHEIARLAGEEDGVGAIVVGLPRRLDGTATDMTPRETSTLPNTARACKLCSGTARRMVPSTFT